MSAPVLHDECGGLVVVDGGRVFDVGGGEHLCADYVAWHRPVDGRHPSDLDVVGGWRPRPAAPVRAA